MRHWSNIGLAWILFGFWSWLFLGLISILFKSSSWHGVWMFEKGLVFWCKGDGLWVGIYEIGFLRDEGDNVIGFRNLESWNGFMSRMGLVGSVSMDNPWEVSTLEVKLQMMKDNFHGSFWDMKG